MRRALVGGAGVCVAQVDPRLTIWDAHSFGDLLGTELATPRLSNFLLGAFAFVALLLAAIGLYGMMAFTVREETREIGLRMALGAGPERVRRNVLRRALSVIAIGGAVGLIGALASSRVLAGLLFQVEPVDPTSLGAACLLLGVVALAAAYLPARGRRAWIPRLHCGRSRTDARARTQG